MKGGVMTVPKEIKDLLDVWAAQEGQPDKTLLFEVGNAMLPLIQMLGVAEGIPQSRYEVDVHENDPDAVIVRMYWGNFVVERIPDQEGRANLWATYFPVECEEHGQEWVQFPGLSILPHMLRTGLVHTIGMYMAKKVGEITPPPGVVIN